MAKKNVFRDIWERQKYIEQMLTDTPLGTQYQRYLEEEKFIGEIWNFICSGDYGVSELVRGRCIAVAQMGYRSAMEISGCKRSTLAKSLSRAEPQLLKYIGEFTMPLLWANDLERAKMVYMSVRYVGADRLFPAEVADLFPVPADTGVSLADCEADLKMLVSLTKNTLHSRVSKLNQDKVARLCYIINSNDSRYLKVRNALIHLLVNPSNQILELCVELLADLE